MATLTTSWQSLGSATLYSGITVHLDAKYSSQSTANNTSSVQFRLRSVGTSWRTTSGTAKFTGAYTDSKSCATYPDYIESGDTIYSISKTVKHNDNGSKSLSIGGAVTAYIGNASQTATISNKTATLPTIDRLATVSSATDFTDEGNPTVTFSNPAGFTTKPYLNFYDNNSKLVYQLYRDTNVTSPYTWSITDEERTALRKATNQQQTYKVSVGVDTYNGTTKLGYNSQSKTMSYVNAEPTAKHTLEETNQKVIEVLGTSDATTIVQNVSQPKLTVTPTANKEATISKVVMSYNGIAYTISEGVFEKVFVANSSEFYYKVYDSRGFATDRITVSSDVIEYLPIEISNFSFKRVDPTSSDLLLNTQIRYKQATFSLKANVPTISWKCGAEGTLNTLTSDDYTINEFSNTITITNLTLSDVLPYTEENRLYLYVSDLLTEDTENEIVIRGIPTCDMGEHDFQVNGNFYIADVNRENKKEIGVLVKDLLYPIGSIRVTPTNSNPSSYLGGTWQLIDKEFKSNYVYYENDSSVYPYTNISAGTLRANFGGHTLNLSFSFTLKTAISDTTVQLTTLDYSKLGISTTAGSIWINGHSDGGNASVFLQLTEDGIINVNDIVPESSVASGNTVNGFFSVIVPYNRMLDSFCDKFYWQRTG